MYIYLVLSLFFSYADCQIYLSSLASDWTATQLQATFQRAFGIGSGLNRYAFLKSFIIKTVAFFAW